MKFHISKSGEPAPCTASARACPVGGESEHFDSPQEAMDWSMKQAMNRDFEDFYESGMTDEQMDEMGADLDFDGVDDDFDLDDDAAALLEEWNEEEIFLWARDKDMEPYSEAQLAEYKTAEEEALEQTRKAHQDFIESVKDTPTAWMIELLDDETSEAAAKELSSYQGLKALQLMTEVIEKETRRQFEAGEISEGQFRDELDTLSAMRFLINPLDGRRNENKRELKGPDPEFIKMLRCLYISKFGRDPFEAGLSAGALIKMFNEGKLLPEEGDGATPQ